MSRRRNITTTPLLEEVVARIQENHRDWHGTSMTFGQALDWLVRDFEWCEPDKPAWGRWSPTLTSIIRKSLDTTRVGDGDPQ